MSDCDDSSAKTQLNWVSTGTEHSSTILLIHAVGYDLTYWDKQIEALCDSYNVVAFDLPGHGRSPGAPEDWTFPKAVATVSQLIEDIGGRPIHLIGISFGGMIAQATALARPELIRSLTLIGTAPTFPDSARAAMKTRAEQTRTGGMQAVLQSSLERWFTGETRARRPDIVDRVSKTMLANDPAVHASIWEMISKFDVHDRLSEIRCPTLILVGEHDPSTPPSVASALAAKIPGSKLVVLPNASHIATVEVPVAVNIEIKQLLAAVEQ